jgi:periplasmic protein CpxP/Spy
MKTMMFRRNATRLGAVVLCSAALSLVPMLGTTPMLAQGGGGGGRGGMMQTPQQQLDALNTALTLTPDQQTKVKAILDDSTKKMTDVRNSGADPADMRPKMMAIRTDQQTQIKALLTDDQKPKYDAYLAAQPQGRRGGGGPGGPGGSGGAPPPPPQ